jgi:AraC family transcriptional regulator
VAALNIATGRDGGAVPKTIAVIWSKRLPESGHEAADAPRFERFDDAFDFQTGEGGLEIWIPIKT